MSLAVEHLRDYLTREKVTQAEFGKACGYDASLVSNVLSGSIGISARNIERLLHGVKPAADKLRFIAAYLRDQIPAEHVHQVAVTIEDSESADGAKASDEASLVSVAMTHLLDELPMHTKTQLYHFVKALRRDTQLRVVFEGLMRYVPGDSNQLTSGTAAPLENRKKETSGPFLPGVIKAVQARKEEEEAQTRDKNKSTRDGNIRPRSARERKQVVRP